MKSRDKQRSFLRDPIRRIQVTVAAIFVLADALAFGFGSGPARAALSHALIQGSGSSWSANAVNQWIADVQQTGLQVVYTSVGSAQGRKDFAYKTTDYAVSDIGYLGVDPVTGEQDTSLGRTYVYLPIVAGGTSFPYQIRVAGQLVTNLRLSGLTLAKIFTNQIRNWNDPEITSDNNGRKLPSIPIIPVVHSEGSGSTAQFTRYLAHRYPSIWKAYSGTSVLTEYYPRQGQQVAQNGSDGVMNFISSAAANGSIGYDEYSYALGKNYPVIKLENSAGYFTAPTQYNVAVALTQAKINMDKNPSHCQSLGYSPPCYLLQNLDSVYAYGDKRAYPMSSYSYMIIPTASDDPRMTTAKRQTLADFIGYSICDGQAEMGPIGYSPLPINLVQASFSQVGALQAADPNVHPARPDVSQCNNPTFVKGNPRLNHLAQIAPLPPLCDKSGQGPCTGNEGIINLNPQKGKVPTTSGPGPVTGAGGKGGGGGGKGGKTSLIPGQTNTPGLPTNAQIVAEPTTLPGRQASNLSGLLAGSAALELILLLALPPLFTRFRPRRLNAPGQGSKS
ncbi:MAG TPA: substrate-binding domain-containing protein [Actinomycetota bacterium]|nr:substrate-binding domain-containing protein [Actinomycetota bacterium]